MRIIQSLLKCCFVGLLTLLLLVSCKPSSEKLDSLIAQLNDQDTSVRHKAALELARYGKHSEPAVQSLIRLLRDPNPGVRSSAAYALREINTKEAQAALERAG